MVMDIYNSTEITVHQLNEIRQKNAKIQLLMLEKTLKETMPI